MGSGIKGLKRAGIRDHSPGIWNHDAWDRDQQCFSWNQGSGSLPFGRGSRVEGKWSRVEGKWSRVEGNKSRVEKFFTIIFQRRQIKISYRPVFTRVSGARFIE